MSAAVVKDARGVPVKPGDTIVYATGGNYPRRGTALVDRTAGSSRIYFVKRPGDRWEQYVRSDCAYVVTLPGVGE